MAPDKLEDVETIADALEERAELEGVAKGFRTSARRQLTIWTIRWSFGLAAAMLVAVAVEQLWWLPLAAGTFALLSLAGLFITRGIVKRRIDQARQAMIDDARAESKRTRTE